VSECVALPHVAPELENGVSAALNGLSPRPNTFEIVRVVAAVWNVTGAELVGPRQEPRFVLPRHVAMTIIRLLIGTSFVEIGRRFGGRDHSSVHHAYKKFGATVGRLLEKASQSERR
jgi:chromosomal replication initiator protein